MFKVRLRMPLVPAGWIMELNTEFELSFGEVACSLAGWGAERLPPQ